jgi:Ca-activated chloride channel homolog
MNFHNWSILPFILIAAFVYLFVVSFYEKKFFRFIQLYWFYRRSVFSYFSSFLFTLGVLGLLLSLLDLRGPEEKIKTPTPKERTIILIDTSASMLAEDIRPSRLQKASLLAKHFARKAAGHELAVVAFSEITKKIVPFTTDIDLIDARLDSVKNLRNQYASSAVSLAIQESVQFLKESGEEAKGNILVLTDGEETAGSLNLNVPSTVNVALVGIGTSNGGRIPLDDSRGFRFGYKKDKGVDVVSKLNETFFKAAVADIPSAKYWIANSYTLPSEEIVQFFKSSQLKSDREQDLIVRPVLALWVLIPAITLIILSYLLKSIRVFSALSLLVISFSSFGVELSPEVSQSLERLSQGELSNLERLKLADDLHRSGAIDEARALYEETLPFPNVDSNLPAEAYLNYGTSLMQKNEMQKALGVYETLEKSLPEGEKKEKISRTIEKNILTHFKKKEEEKQQKKGQKKQQNKDNKPGEKGGKSDDQSSSSKSSSDPSQGEQKDQDKKEPGENEKDDDKNGNKAEDDEKKDSKPQDGEKDKKQEPKPEDANEQQIQARKKVDPKLKQLLDDDRQLQLKMIENGTRELNKRQSRKNKDW